jgi:hypothetical protein
MAALSSQTKQPHTKKKTKLCLYIIYITMLENKQVLKKNLNLFNIKSQFLYYYINSIRHKFTSNNLFEVIIINLN